jgi:signal transduction histidine kinase
MTEAWTEAARVLAPLLDGARFELRFSLGGQAAVRALAPAGAVAARHAEPPDPPAPWSVRADCGDAAGWLLAERAPTDEPLARLVLQRAVDRHSSLLLQRIAAQRGRIAADMLEAVTHRLRTDISALQVIAEGALTVPFEDDERSHVRAEVGQVGAEAQRRLSAVREVMASLHPGAAREAEPLVDTLARELEGAGVETVVEMRGRAPGGGVVETAVAAAAAGERPVALVPGPGWSACARLLAAAVAADGRLAGARLAVGPHPDGWSVTAGAEAGGVPLPWTERALGELAHAGMIAVAAGGSVLAAERAGRLRIELTVPAAPSG